MDDEERRELIGAEESERMAKYYMEKEREAQKKAEVAPHTKAAAAKSTGGKFRVKNLKAPNTKKTATQNTFDMPMTLDDSKAVISFRKGNSLFPDVR